MAKKNKNKKQKLLKTPENESQKKVEEKKKKKKQIEKDPVVVKEEESDDSLSEPESESDKIQKLIEPYSKDKLIEIICDAAVKDSTIVQRIRSIADRDISHRKIFVHGLGWDTTHETLTSVFKSYGEIEDLHLVMDKTTGKAKGYGFVMFKTRAAANKALKEPQKKINNRVTYCQLASTGPAPAAVNSQDPMSRKIYVSNVPSDVDAERLRTFFAKFGEIETGPMGFDFSTGKSRGFAIFVYKTQEGARKVLQEPYKMYEGHQLHCQKATENRSKPAVAVQQPAQTPVLAAVAASQNLALFNQHPTLNPLYGRLVGHPNAGFVGGSFNPMMAGPLNPIAIPSTQVAGSSFGNTMGLGGYSAPYGLSTFPGNPSLLGPYGSSGTALPGLQSYQSSGLQSYQSSSLQPSSRAFPGYPS